MFTPSMVFAYLVWAASTLESFPRRDRAATGGPGAEKGSRNHRSEISEYAY
jgi:hypothetical protein